jgi:non-ribosomal peptide synthetase component F
MALNAYAHQDIPFERLVEELQPERSLSHQPLFQVMLSWQNAPQRALNLSELRLEGLAREGVTASFDLNLILAESREGIGGVLEYSTDLFESSTIRRMLA